MSAEAKKYKNAVYLPLRLAELVSESIWGAYSSQLANLGPFLALLQLIHTSTN